MIIKKIERTNFREYCTDSIQVRILNEINYHTNMSMLHRVEVYLNPDLDPLKRHSKNIDLYNDLVVKSFVQEATVVLKISLELIEQALQDVRTDLEETRLTYQENNKEISSSTVSISQEEKEEAEAYLSDKSLLTNLISDLETLGIYGDKKEMLLQYFSMISRQGCNPLIIVGSDRTGLTSNLAGLMPEADKIEVDSWSPNTLYFFGDTLKRKLLIIRNGKSVLNNQTELARLSKGELNRIIPAKTKSGKISNIVTTSQGGLSIVIISNEEINFESPDFIQLTDKEEILTTKKTLEFQKRKLAGLINNKMQDKIKAKLINIQQLIKPIQVVIPLELQVKFPDGIKDQIIVEAQFYSVVETICLFHQYQREIKKKKGIKEPYVEATKEDIELAVELFEPILQSKVDDLKPDTRMVWVKWCEALKEKKQDSFSSIDFKNDMNLYPVRASRVLKELRSRNYIDLERKDVKCGNVFSVKKMLTGT